jgi:hypothetical protein
VTAIRARTGHHARVQRGPLSPERVLECLECGDESTEAHGWKAFVDEELGLLVYCDLCAEREFGE